MTATYLEDLFGLTGKVALVTGGGGSIGQMIAAAFLGAGAERVYLASRDLANLDRICPALSPEGRCLPLRADLSSVKGCEMLAEDLRALEPGLDILVNNAGTGWRGDFASYAEKGWDTTFDLNLKAPFFLIQQLLPALQPSGGRGPSRVINVGSIGADFSDGGRAYAYGLSKGALHHMTRMLAYELADRSITVNTIAPGRVASAMTRDVIADERRYHREVARVPLKRWASSSDLGAAAVYLASTGGAFLTGISIVVDGGTMLVPPFPLAGE